MSGVIWYLNPKLELAPSPFLLCLQGVHFGNQPDTFGGELFVLLVPLPAIGVGEVVLVSNCIRENGSTFLIT